MSIVGSKIIQDKSQITIPHFKPNCIQLLSEQNSIQEQREALNIAFALDPYPSGAAIDYLANEINAEVWDSFTNYCHHFIDECVDF